MQTLECYKIKIERVLSWTSSLKQPGNIVPVRQMFNCANNIWITGADSKEKRRYALIVRDVHSYDDGAKVQRAI